MVILNVSIILMSIFSLHLQANASSAAQAKIQREQTKQDRQQIKKLAGELRRKEKALAEAAALLILQKKAQATWGGGEDE